jgi:hypothetical protein
MEAVAANFKIMLRNTPGGTKPTIQSQCSIDIRDHPSCAGHCIPGEGALATHEKGDCDG